MKVGQNRGLTARLVAIGVLQCDCAKTENDLSNKKNLISTPASASKCYYQLVFFLISFKYFQGSQYGSLAYSYFWRS